MNTTTTFTPLEELKTSLFASFDEDIIEESEELDEEESSDELDEFGDEEDGENGNDGTKKPGFDLDPFGEPKEPEF